MTIESQENVTWDLWRQIVTTTEELGFESLCLSDHFVTWSGPRSREALETFIAFTIAAEITSRIRLGPLVASTTFRHPALVARMAAQIDVLSRGRFVLGVGAGWNQPEHHAFGISLPPAGERMDHLDESIKIIKALWSDTPANFEGRFYQLRDAECYPKPIQQPMPLLVGARGERRALRIVAEHATEWNMNDGKLASYLRKREILEQHCADVGRSPSAIKHSQMMAYIIGRDETDLRRHLGSVMAVRPQRERDPDLVLEYLRTRGWLVGTPSHFVDEVGRREEAGISRVMLQHMAVDDFDALELIGTEVLPQVHC